MILKIIVVKKDIINNLDILDYSLRVSLSNETKYDSMNNVNNVDLNSLNIIDIRIVILLYLKTNYLNMIYLKQKVQTRLILKNLAYSNKIVNMKSKLNMVNKKF